MIVDKRCATTIIVFDFC